MMSKFNKYPELENKWVFSILTFYKIYGFIKHDKFVVLLNMTNGPYP